MRLAKEHVAQQSVSHQEVGEQPFLRTGLEVRQSAKATVPSAFSGDSGDTNILEGSRRDLSMKSPLSAVDEAESEAIWSFFPCLCFHVSAVLVH